MDRLNTAIAEKVLEISNADNEEIRVTLQKINRFRDFINACQTLIKKYPEIETELLKMLYDNDFDARVASSRVDTIIRLSESQSLKNTVADLEEDIHQLEDIIENLPNQPQPIIHHTRGEEIIHNQSVTSTENVKDTSFNKNSTIEGNTAKPLPEAQPIDEDKEQQYVDFEEIPNTDLTDVENVVNYSKENPTISINDKKLKSAKGTSTIKKVLWIVVIVATIAILWIVVKFVVSHWTTILWILGICAVVALIIWYFLKRKK